MQRPGEGLITHWSRTKMAEKVKKIYTCCQFDFNISLHLVYLWWHLAQSTSITLQFMVLSRNWWFVSWFSQQTRKSSASMTMTCICTHCECRNWGKYAYLSIVIIIFRWINIKKNDFRSPFFILVTVTKQKFYLGFFITTHWEHFLKHWYNALMVAQTCCGCWFHTGKITQNNRDSTFKVFNYAIVCKLKLYDPYQTIRSGCV